MPLNVNDLPVGSAPRALSFGHFPDRLHAFVWRNWALVPVKRMAAVLGAPENDIAAIAKRMGLGEPPVVSEDQWTRTYITILRRNWHLLPYEQLLQLLEWSAEKMDYVLREGDGLFWWFGGCKPVVERLQYTPPSESAISWSEQIGAVVREHFPGGVTRVDEPLFGFLQDLLKPVDSKGSVSVHAGGGNAFSPRFCYSYFGAFREPLSDIEKIYPREYLARLADTGVDGVWLHEPLFRLARFPWDAKMSKEYEKNVASLRVLVSRAREFGIGVYLYINEPRPMPMRFFKEHPELKGVDDRGVLSGQVATLCTSLPEVKDYLRDSIAAVCDAVPDLGGIFTITASENYTNCWSHYDGQNCPRCAKRAPEEVIAEVNSLLAEGIAKSKSACQLIVWDWGWKNEWAEGIIQRLPKSAAFMSVSEWEMPFQRGGVSGQTGEYALSVVGPGPRAQRHWGFARASGLKTIAKIPGGTTWELGSVPFIPVVETVAKHVANLRELGIEGLMMSWTLGGYPCANIEAEIQVGQPEERSVDEVLLSVARRRFGEACIPAVVRAWKRFSAAFQEFPFCGSVLYQSPNHMGPANLLWAEPTGYHGTVTMGFACPFDDVDTWRGPYPAEVFAEQFEKVASGFEEAIAEVVSAVGEPLPPALGQEMGVAEACAVHFRSVGNQVRFVQLRNQLAAGGGSDAATALKEIERILRDEVNLAVRLHAIQKRDSRIGFEAACQYFYVDVDFGEKVINCCDLLYRWLPAVRTQHSI